MNLAPVFAELDVYPPGGNGAGAKLQEQFFVHVHAAAGVRAEPERGALEHGPGKRENQPEFVAPVFVYANEAQHVIQFARAALFAVDIEHVVHAAEESGQKHDAYRDIRETANPVEADSNEGYGYDYQKSAHDRHADFGLPRSHRQGGIVLGASYQAIFVERFCQQWRPEESNRRRT